MIDTARSTPSPARTRRATHQPSDGARATLATRPVAGCPSTGLSSVCVFTFPTSKLVSNPNIGWHRSSNGR